MNIKEITYNKAKEHAEKREDNSWNNHEFFMFFKGFSHNVIVIRNIMQNLENYKLQIYI